MNTSAACLRPLDPPPPPPPPPPPSSLRSRVRPLTTPHARRPRTHTGGAQAQKRPDTRGARSGAAISSFGDLTVSGYQRRQPTDRIGASDGVCDDPRQLNTTADELSRDLRAPKWGASISLNNARRQNRSDQRRLAIALQRLQRQLATVTKRITDRESEVVDELLERCPRAEKDVIRMFRNQPLVMRRLGLPRGVGDPPEATVDNATRSRKVKHGSRRRNHPAPLPELVSTPRGVVLPPYYGNQLLLTGKCLVRPGADKSTDPQPAAVTVAPTDTTESISGVGRRLASLSTPQMKQAADDEVAASTTGYDVTAMRNQGDLAIEEVARRHVYSHQIPSMLNRGSRAAQYVADLRRTMFPEWPEPVEEGEPPTLDDPVGPRAAVALAPIVGTPRVHHSRPVGVSHPPNKDLMRATTIALLPKS